MSVHLTVMFSRFDRATPQLLFKNDHYTTGKGPTLVGPAALGTLPPRPSGATIDGLSYRSSVRHTARPRRIAMSAIACYRPLADRDSISEVEESFDESK
jgi:hypothetical protein